MHNCLGQDLDMPQTLRRNEAEFGHVSAQCIDQHCATLSIIGHALPLSTITRAALATPHCVDADTHMDAPSAVSRTGSLQWRASSCNDRLCLTLSSAEPPHHKAPFFVPSQQPFPLSSSSRVTALAA
jgi:hypothetical protein